MIYIILNAFFCVALIWTSFKTDTGFGVKNSNSLVNVILFLAALFGLHTGLIVLGFYAPLQFVVILGKLELTLNYWFAVQFCFYILSFPDYGSNKAAKILRWVFNAVAFYFVFFNDSCITNLYLNSTEGFVIESEQIFGGDFGEFLPISGYQLVNIFYLVVFPAFCTIMLLVRAENRPVKIDRQRMVLIALGVASFWFVHMMVSLASKVQPVFNTLYFVPYVVAILIFIKAVNLDNISGWTAAFKSGIKYILKFVLPALLTGLIFASIWPMYSDSQATFIIIYILVIAIVQTVWYQGRKYLDKYNLLRGDKYAKIFEDQLASIDYDEDTSEITKQLFNIFKQNLTTSSIKILIDNGEGELETIYSSNDEKFKVPFSNPCFDTLLNLNQSILFRDYAEHNYNVASVRTELKQLLDDSGSDAFILLNEGRRIVGAIFLGKKSSGNNYNEYDYSVFTKLYSYFFVVGYYMKNIVNESVVGTVNREIKMSGQIITSIQENMDFIKNSKIDAGYLMVPAHNIGGEFIDLIRLSETRHLFVIGALNGKGIAASMNMVILKSVIRTFLAETTDFKLLVEKTNSFIRNSLPKGSYFAGMFGLLDFSTDTMYYINCGSPALFLFTRAYNNVIEIQGEGRILGFAKDISGLIKVKKVKLAAGDIVLTCTDGLIETRSLRGEMYGKERTQHAMTENSTYPANKMAQFTYDSLVQFTSKELEDDITILVMKYKGGK